MILWPFWPNSTLQAAAVATATTNVEVVGTPLYELIADTIVTGIARNVNLSLDITIPQVISILGEHICAEQNAAVARLDATALAQKTTKQSYCIYNANRI